MYKINIIAPEFGYGNNELCPLERMREKSF